MQGGDSGRAKREVETVIYAFFEAGKNKDLTSLEGFHAPPGLFTKFDETPPYTRQNAEEAFIYEQAAFANISDYEYKLDELRIDFINDVAVATFYLTCKGVFVNNYSFEGRTVGSRSRVTMVLARFPSGWRIVHEHFSPFLEWAGRAAAVSKSGT
jgi:ketosteroid isomerase-like protein